MIMIMQKIFRLSTVLFVAGTCLAGCDISPVPKADDEEIIVLLGKVQGSFSRDENVPLVIVKQTVECAELLSGLNADIIKDMPAELLRKNKTQCQQEFDKAVKDTVRNTKGFKLKHFKNKDFAKRIVSVAEKSEIFYKDYQLKRQKEKEAQLWQEKRQELVAAQVEFEKSLEDYEARADDIVALCTEIGKVRDALREKGDTHMAGWAMDDICTTSKEEMLKAADENRAKWAAVEVVEGSFEQPTYITPNIDDFRIGSTQGLENYIHHLRDTLGGLQRALIQ